MKQFEVGKTYTCRNIANHDDTFAIKVIKRTEKTLTFIFEGKKRNKRIAVDKGEEFIAVGNYSMAPVFKAGRSIMLN